MYNKGDDEWEIKGVLIINNILIKTNVYQQKFSHWYYFSQVQSYMAKLIYEC